METTDIIIYSVIGLAVLVMVFLGLREVNCWYWKVNERLDEQKKTNVLLTEIRDSFKRQT